MVLVMGFGMRRVVWRHQVDGLRPHHPVLTYDHRGIGDSHPAAEWPTMDTLRDDLLRVVDDAGLGRFHLVGVSMGGMVAQHVALHAPHRLHSLSLVVTQAGRPLAWVPPARGIASFLRVQRAADPTTRARAMERLLFAPGFRDRVTPSALATRHIDTGAPAAPSALLRQLHAIVRHRTHHRLHELRTPTLVVGAAHDRLIAPRHSEHLARAIPGARFVRIGPAGHGIIFEAAAELNRELLAHMRAHEPATIG